MILEYRKQTKENYLAGDQYHPQPLIYHQGVKTVNATWISTCEIGFIVSEQLWGHCKRDRPPLRPSEHYTPSALRPFLHHAGGRAVLLWILKSRTCNLGQVIKRKRCRCSTPPLVKTCCVWVSGPRPVWSPAEKRMCMKLHLKRPLLFVF